MITVSPINDREKTAEYFKKCGCKYSEHSGCSEAVCGNETLGYGIYELDESKMTVLAIEPENGLMLADGILRSVLHLASRRGISEVYCSDKALPLCEKLGFIKSKEKKQLDISLLTKDCCHSSDVH